jgi:ABC-2 type transport system permease protein
MTTTREEGVEPAVTAIPQEGGLELRDVHGPSALGGGWKRFWELTVLIASTDFKRTYFGTTLGYLWSVARPLLLFAVLVEVFTHVFKLGSQIPHYPVFLLLNMVLFGFFQEATITAVTSIVGQEGIVRKTQFPRLAIPTAVVLTAFFNLLLNLIVVFIFILGFGVSPMWTWLLLPVILAMFWSITLPVSMLLSSLYPRFRDLSIIWAVFATALFYATPVLYSFDKVESRSPTIATLIALNPLTPMLQLAHRWIIGPPSAAPYPGTAAAGGPGKLIASIAILLILIGLSVWVFNREAPRIAEEL